MIYFDNAATLGIRPPSVINAVNTALRQYSVNPGRGGYDKNKKCSEIIYSCRSEISDFFTAEQPMNVVFTPSCTHSINYVLKGVLNSGDRVIVSSLEHNAVIRPLYELQQKGVIVDVAEVIFGDDEATLRTIKNLIKKETKLIFIMHASNVLGTVLPIEKIGEICRENGILFGVDAAQTAGYLDINMKKCRIDFLCIAPHKGLYSPPGIGVLIANKPIETTVIEGGTGTASLLARQPDDMPERFESGTLNVPAIFGVKSGVKYITEKGRENLYNKSFELLEDCYSALKKIRGVKLYTEYPKKYKFVATISFNVADYSSEQVAEFLAEKGIAVRGGLHCAPMAHRHIGTVDRGTVRASFSPYNTKQELEFFLKAVSDISFKEKTFYFY